MLGATAVVALSLLSGCSGGGRVGTVDKHTQTSTRRIAPPLVTQPTRAIVTMRALTPQSMHWELVSINARGSGILTTLIGELGAVGRHFRLPPRQAARLRRLVHNARGAPVPPVKNAHSTLYTLHIVGTASENVQGGGPKPTMALVNFLSGLMQEYCC